MFTKHYTKAALQCKPTQIHIAPFPVFETHLQRLEMPHNVLHPRIQRSSHLCLERDPSKADLGQDKAMIAISATQHCKGADNINMV